MHWDKLEVPHKISRLVSGDGGQVSPAEAEKEIEEIKAEMKRLEAEIAHKKSALSESSQDPLPEQEEESAEAEAEKSRLEGEAKDALRRAEAEAEEAKSEAEDAVRKAEIEEEEAEEARVIAEIEEEEAREAKAEAELAKRRLDEAVRKVEEAGKDIEQFTADAERSKREDAIVERVGKRSGSIDWSQIGSSEGMSSDDLTRINGIDDFAQRKLNALGISTFEQLSKIDSKITEVVNDALEFVPGRVAELEWTKQAITMIGLEGVDTSSHGQEALEDTGMADLSAAKINWAQIGKAGDRKSDQLTKIKGIDRDIEKKLKVLGIRTFEQISKMDKDTSEAVNGALGLMQGRVTKMMWSQQAMSLIEQG